MYVIRLPRNDLLTFHIILKFVFPQHSKKKKKKKTYN